MKAVVTSNKECCLINTVDIIIETQRNKEPIRIALWFLRRWLFMTAMWHPSELYTWMLGHKLVGVSAL